MYRKYRDSLFIIQYSYRGNKYRDVPVLYIGVSLQAYIITQQYHYWEYKQSLCDQVRWTQRMRENKHEVNNTNLQQNGTRLIKTTHTIIQGIWQDARVRIRIFR